MKEGRFIRVSKEDSGATVVEIWVDQETGVNYLYMREGFTGGLTILTDADGKPIVTK